MNMKCECGIQRGNGSQQDVRDSYVLTNTKDGGLLIPSFTSKPCEKLRSYRNNTSHYHKDGFFFVYCYRPAEAFR